MLKWNDINTKKPTKNGWYSCTVEVSGQQRYVMDLYWYSDRERFIDNRVKHIFEVYDVIGDKGKKIEKYRLTDRTDSVVAWRKIPKPYMSGFVKVVY